MGPVSERLQDTNESSLAGIIIVQIDMLAVNEHILRAQLNHIVISRKMPKVDPLAVLLMS